MGSCKQSGHQRHADLRIAGNGSRAVHAIEERLDALTNYPSVSDIAVAPFDSIRRIAGDLNATLVQMRMCPCLSP